MANIRIADTPHPVDALSCTESQDCVRSVIAPNRNSIYRPTSRVLAEASQEDIYNIHYNIRSRPLPNASVDRIRSRSRSQSSAPEREDDDPGLRQPGDFKQKQVRNCLNLALTAIANNITDTPLGVQGKCAGVAGLSVYRRYLRRHRHQSSLRVLLDLHVASFKTRPNWSPFHNNLDALHDGYGEVRHHHPEGR